MVERTVKSGVRLNPNLRAVWVVTFIGIAVVICSGALALLIPPEFGSVLVIAIGIAAVVGFAAWIVFLFCVPCRNIVNKDKKPEKAA